MSKFGIVLFAAAATYSLAATAGAYGNHLAMVHARAPAIYCAYAKDCKPKMTDTDVTFRVPGDNGDARLITRTLTGEPDSANAGRTLYLYRLDMTGVTSGTNCISDIDFDFGTVVRSAYEPGDKTSEMIVVQKGDVGKYAPSQSQYAGHHVWFPIPTIAGLCPGESTHFWGMANPSDKPGAGKAQLKFKQGKPIEAEIRIPQ